MAKKGAISQGSDSGSAETRDRLLAAAAEVFAREGFRKATIREICDRAGANVAAVNYHFRDKKGLYSEVIRAARDVVESRYPSDISHLEPTDIEGRLRYFVASMLGRLFDPGATGCLMCLTAHEIRDPTEALDIMVAIGIRPRFEQLCEVVRTGCGGNVDEEQVQLISLSIVGQCLNLFHSRPIVERLMPAIRFETEALEPLIEHITKFSLAAISCYADGRASSSGRGDGRKGGSR